MLKDADIREPLFDFLETTFGKTRIIEEKVIGRSRADVVMVVEDAIIGVEIKSDADTYARLPRQIKDYDKYYDFNYVVIGTSHAAHIYEHIPPYWGVITVEEIEGKADFYLLRQACNNPKCKLQYKLRILWRPELKQLQKHFLMPKYNEKSKDYVVKAICDRTLYDKKRKGYIDICELNHEISELLFERDYNTIGERIEDYRKRNR